MIASSGWIDGPYWMENADSTPDSAPAGGAGRSDVRRSGGGCGARGVQPRRAPRARTRRADHVVVAAAEKRRRQARPGRRDDALRGGGGGRGSVRAQTDGGGERCARKAARAQRKWPRVGRRTCTGVASAASASEMDNGLRKGRSRAEMVKAAATRRTRRRARATRQLTATRARR